MLTPSQAKMQPLSLTGPCTQAAFEAFDSKVASVHAGTLTIYDKDIKKTKTCTAQPVELLTRV